MPELPRALQKFQPVNSFNTSTSDQNILPKYDTKVLQMADESVSGSAATLQKMQDLLKAKDDTSRFVGLALLKSVLDNGHLGQDSQDLRELWGALSPKFLDRLLRARQNEKLSQTDSKDMVDLAVAVLHTFTILLPQDCRRDKRLTERTAPLVKALVLRYVSYPFLDTLSNKTQVLPKLHSSFFKHF